jgi:hypothetical protein
MRYVLDRNLGILDLRLSATTCGHWPCEVPMAALEHPIENRLKYTVADQGPNVHAFGFGCTGSLGNAGQSQFEGGRGGDASFSAPSRSAWRALPPFPLTAPHDRHWPIKPA